ncbi:glycoside hydrolase family 6 protein [Sodiomyces alcalophilus JCM 7366]|uniref:glycoside hydrolase family 6 protein n=1 Tax=Sodiomyces alcalophilus JCM 7366 TaxID=591952 RepID=UPI0039B467AE
MAGRLLLAGAVLSAVALAAPTLEERQNCASLWGQCAGNGWSGPTCCESGSTCTYQNDWYSQCLPGGSSPPPTSPPPTNPPPTNPPPTTPPPTSPPPTSPPPTSPPPSSPPPSSGGGNGDYTGNPFIGVDQWANSFYRDQVLNLAVPQLSPAMAAAAQQVAEVPSFQWIDKMAKIPLIADALAEIRAANNAGGNYAAILVVYNLPDRDCAAAASNGEFALADDGANKYKNYIAEIRALLVQYSDIRTILVIEPDSLANMVTNMDVPKCQGAASAYKELTIHAITELNLSHVAMYLDAGHAGWLGWPANVVPAATLFTQLYNDAGRPAAVRGFALNVSNYNAWNATSPAPYTAPNPVYDERGFVDSFGPLLSQNGWDATFIVDQGRSGKQPTGQQEWGHWCNAKGTGFGMRPTANTGHSRVDAFVWIKPGGECDGISDPTAPRYDHMCSSASSMQGAPQAGEWFQEYFEMLLENANPSFL